MGDKDLNICRTAAIGDSSLLLVAPSRICCLFCVEKYGVTLVSSWYFNVLDMFVEMRHQSRDQTVFTLNRALLYTHPQHK